MFVNISIMYYVALLEFMYTFINLHSSTTNTYLDSLLALIHFSPLAFTDSDLEAEQMDLTKGGNQHQLTINPSDKWHQYAPIIVNSSLLHL